MRVLRTFVVAALILPASSTAAWAQLRLPRTVTPKPTGSTPHPPSRSAIINHDFSRLVSIAPGASIEVDTADGRLLVGKFVSADAGGLTMKIDLRLETLKRNDIEHVQGYETDVKHHALVGAAGGAVLGLFFTASLAPSVARRAGSMAIGGALGAASGAFSGVLRHHRIVLYARS